VRILIAAVGRAKPGPHLELQRLYGDRLSWPLTVSEVEEKRKLSPAERCQRESEMLLARVPDRAVIVALDERGSTLTSAAFAQKIAKWRDTGAGDLAFLIGGADGHADSLRERADFLLSLGTMTWPHLLVRGMLLEQLYRAQQILAGHPYHRE
jgi:23S rRNA (pseudouridine1915-N3)-methyltransferase